MAGLKISRGKIQKALHINCAEETLDGIIPGYLPPVSDSPQTFSKCIGFTSKGSFKEFLSLLIA
jgi:hypothetical protein